MELSCRFDDDNGIIFCFFTGMGRIYGNLRREIDFALHPLTMPDVRTLLIVDDCAEDRKIYRRYLAKDLPQTYQIIEATCAEQGLNLYQTHQSDVVLLDFCLPDMTGIEFLDQLQALGLQPPFPIIMLTGQGDEAIAVQAIKGGAQDYLVKNFLKPEVLQLAVRNVIRQSGLQAQLLKTQDRQRLIATTALRIRQSLNLDQILHQATVEVQRLLQCDRVLVHQFAPDRSGTVVAESVEPQWQSALGSTIQESYFQLNSDPLYPEGYQHVVPNVYAAGFSDCYLKLLQRFEVKANLMVPILLNSDGAGTKVPKLWGLLIAHQCDSDRQWQEDEVGLFRELAVQLTIAIQQAERLAQTQAALVKEKELNAFKSHIIATVSHEYRTPLASILAAAATLEQHKQRLDASQQNKLLLLIQEKTRHLSTLVEDMLLVKELEFDKAQFNPQPLDLQQFLVSLIEEQQELAGDRYELTYRMTGDPQGFWGDRGLLHQIFMNLVSNALKYSPDGGVIDCHLVSQESQIIFSIQDQGMGIPTADQAHLFQAFSRGSNVDTLPGTGLGLAIVKACVELHEGYIVLESQVGQGTIVRVTLPKYPTQVQGING